MSKLRMTTRHLAVTLTASQWNSILVVLADARRQYEDDYTSYVAKHNAALAVEVSQAIREQVGVNVREAFEHDYPDESKALPFDGCVKIGGAA